MVLGVGIDVIEVQEFRSGLDDARLGELFLQEELAYARTQARLWENLAARAAAKRAVLKALRVTDDEPRWLDVEVTRGGSGEPDVRLHGETLRHAGEIGARELRLSMSHTRTAAVAVVVVEG